MKIGLVVPGHVAARAIISACRGAGHEARAIDVKTIDASTCSDLEAVVVASAPNPRLLHSLLSAIGLHCHLVYVSSCMALPSRPVCVPWGEDDFDVTGEVLPGQGASRMAREAERLLFVGGSAHRWTILRPAIVEGPSDPDPTHTRWFVERLLSGEPVCLPDGDMQPYGHVSTGDLASAVTTVLGQAKTDHRVLHVCSETILTPALHARAVAEALKRELSLRFVDGDAWDRAGLPQPMAGRSGAALLKPSPILRDLGWASTDPVRFLRNLSKELAEQPRRLDATIRARELALLEPHIFAVCAVREAKQGWMLRAVSRGGPAIDLVRLESASSGPWKTVAVALGEDVERTVSAVGAMGITHDLVAPMLVERRERGSRCEALALGRPVRDAIATGDDLAPTPPDLGVTALLAVPLARLLSAWPTVAPVGAVWILGRGAEALLASWLARDEGREAAILGIVDETPDRGDGMAIEALKRERRGSPAIVINVSAAPEGEEIASHKLIPDGVLITPFVPLLPIPAQRRLIPLPDLPSRAMVECAFALLHQWRERLLMNDCLSPAPLRAASGALAGPALRLPVLVAREAR